MEGQDEGPTAGGDCCGSGCAVGQEVNELPDIVRALFSSDWLRRIEADLAYHVSNRAFRHALSRVIFK